MARPTARAVATFTVYVTPRDAAGGSVAISVGDIRIDTRHDQDVSMNPFTTNHGLPTDRPTQTGRADLVTVG